MITLLICLLLISALVGVTFKLTGTLLKACLWLFISLPVGLVLGTLGIVCCCTLLLIPVGIMLLKTGARVIIPA